MSVSSLALSSETYGCAMWLGLVLAMQRKLGSYDRYLAHADLRSAHRAACAIADDAARARALILVHAVSHVVLGHAFREEV
jgi:hypothetical protein